MQRGSRSRSTSPGGLGQPVGLDGAGQQALLLQVDLHDALIAETSRVIRELQVWVTDLLAQERAAAWQACLTRRVAMLEEAVLGLPGPAPVTPPQDGN